LRERNKELKCLYQTYQIITDPTRSVSEVLRLSVNLLPESWQYPSYTCAMIEYEEISYKTDNYEKTQWSQTSHIMVNGQQMGFVEVNYTKEMPAAFEGPFLKEERDELQ